MGSKSWMLAAAAAAAFAFAAPAAADVRAGIAAWQAGNYDEAVRQWRPLAERGDADAQFNLGHAYRLGRGVAQDMRLAEQYYSRAARAGHEEASAMYGLLLFQNGRRREALPFVERAANAGDPRAQYVYGTALFNGDLVERDWPRAYAMMSRAAAQGLPPAQTQLAEMERHLTARDRARGVELAGTMGQPAAPTPPVRVAASPPPPTVTTTQVPPSRPVAQPAPAAQRPPQPSAPAPRSRPDAPSPAPAAAGRWRIQLGAFSSEANAQRAWAQVSGRLPGLQPVYGRAGNLIRLQAGPLADRAAADRACAAVRGAGGACFAVAP